jgi:thiol:disulfide interchange protein DsbD
MDLSGSPLDFFFAFLGGIVMSFTPCVYPLLSVSVGYIGVNAVDSKLKGFSLSLVYVTGIAITYSILGLIASLTGQLFGRISSSAITNIVVGGIMVVFGIAMFDVFHVSLTNSVKLPTHKKHDYFSTFVLGLASGLIIGPCVTPVLASVLAYLATKSNIAYGMMLLFSFAFGMGVIFILAGTFSGLLLGLPKPGKWLGYIKKIGAVVILATGIYFIYTGIRRL